MKNKCGTSRKFKSSTDEEINKAIRMKKAYLQQLQKENMEFKIVMEGSRKKANEVDQNTMKELQHFYDQMKNFEVKQDSELKKYKLLKQLITYLQLEQIWNRKEEDNIRSALKATQEKQLKKREYDVEQVLQKCNEEIAKISTLREQLEVSRSERVVYSNLFKKLEKEIRIYEEEFKQLLLQSTSIQQKRQIQLSESIYLKRKQQKHSIPIELELSSIQQQFQPSRIQPITKKKISNTTRRTFDQKTDRKFKQIKQVNLEQHQHLKLFIESVVIQSQSQSLEQFINNFGGLQKKNQKIVKQIEKITSQILQLEQQPKNPIFLIQTDDNDLENISLCTNPVNRSFDCSKKQNQIKQSQNCLFEMATMLGVDLSEITDVNELFCLVQKSMPVLFTLDDIHINKFNQEPITTRRGEDQEHYLQNIIEKAEKYPESQKIYAKSCFQEEYSKQTVRVRRITKPKK